MILKNVILDVAPCEFIINRNFVGACRLHLQGRRNNASEEIVRLTTVRRAVKAQRRSGPQLDAQAGSSL
jgi:hypothetical protein